MTLTFTIMDITNHRFNGLAPVYDLDSTAVDNQVTMTYSLAPAAADRMWQYISRKRF